MHVYVWEHITGALRYANNSLVAVKSTWSAEYEISIFPSVG